MIVFLRALFLVVLASMLGVTSWAGLQCPLFAVPRAVATHPWFIATLFDAYWGFVTFYVWVGYRELSWVSRVAWFMAIIALGNIAMSTYCLSVLFKTPPTGKISDLLISRTNRTGWLGIGLATAGVAVTVGAALASHSGR